MKILISEAQFKTLLLENTNNNFDVNDLFHKSPAEIKALHKIKPNRLNGYDTEKLLKVLGYTGDYDFLLKFKMRDLPTFINMSGYLEKNIISYVIGDYYNNDYYDGSDYTDMLDDIDSNNLKTIYDIIHKNNDTYTNNDLADFLVDDEWGDIRDAISDATRYCLQDNWANYVVDQIKESLSEYGAVFFNYDNESIEILINLEDYANNNHAFLKDAINMCSTDYHGNPYDDDLDDFFCVFNELLSYIGKPKLRIDDRHDADCDSKEFNYHLSDTLSNII